MSRDDLFALPLAPEAAPAAGEEPKVRRPPPLAARMRPRSLDEFAGQTHILGPGQLLRRAIESDRIQSLIFYGPPGTAKPLSPSSSPDRPPASLSGSAASSPTWRTCGASSRRRPIAWRTLASP